MANIIMPLNRETGIKYEFTVSNNYYLTNARFCLKAEDLADKKVLETKLRNQLITFESKYISLIKAYIDDEILDCLSKGKVIYESYILGWQNTFDGACDFILEGLNVGSKTIRYYDSEMSFKQGTHQDQIDFIKDTIIPYKETRLAMVLGLTSVVASYLEPHKSIGTLVINVSGKSSTGKSTIAELSASFFATPETSNYGIVRTFNATKNFILGISEGRKGLPIILDDANANRDEHNKADLIYQFAMNEPRGRCGNGGEIQQKRSGWSGLVLMTSESPIIDVRNVSQGANARCINIDSVSWTQSAKHSDEIKAGVRANYGHIGVDYARYVASIDVSELVEAHSIYSQMIKDKMKLRDSLSDRVASKLALIALTADLVHQYNKEFNIDYNEIIDMIVEYEQKSFVGRNLEEAIYELMIEYIYKKRAHFCRYNTTPYGQYSYACSVDAKGDCYGIFDKTAKGNYIYFSKNEFDKFLKDEGVTENRTIIKEWIRNGKIIGDYDHNTVKVSRNSFKGRAIKIPFEAIDKYFPEEGYEYEYEDKHK